MTKFPFALGKSIKFAFSGLGILWGLCLPRNTYSSPAFKWEKQWKKSFLSERAHWATCMTKKRVHYTKKKYAPMIWILPLVSKSMAQFSVPQNLCVKLVLTYYKQKDKGLLVSSALSKFHWTLMSELTHKALKIRHFPAVMPLWDGANSISLLQRGSCEDRAKTEVLWHFRKADHYNPQAKP